MIDAGFQTTPATHHYSFDESYANGKQLCACIRGKDHTKAEMDIPADVSVQLLGGQVSTVVQAPISSDGEKTFYNKVADVKETLQEANAVVPDSKPDAAAIRLQVNEVDPEAWATSFVENFEFDIPVNDTMIQFFQEAINAGHQAGHQAGYKRGKEKADRA